MRACLWFKEGVFNDNAGGSIWESIGNCGGLGKKMDFADLVVFFCGVSIFPSLVALRTRFLAGAATITPSVCFASGVIAVSVLVVGTDTAFFLVLRAGTRLAG